MQIFHVCVLGISYFSFQFESNYGDIGREKKRMLDIFNKVQTGRPTLDINKAVNQHIAKDQQSRLVYLLYGRKGSPVSTNPSRNTISKLRK